MKTLNRKSILLTALVTLGLQLNAQISSGVGGGSGGSQMSGEVAMNLNGTGRTFVRSRIPMEDVTEYQPFLYTEARRANITLLSGASREGMFLYNLESESLINTETDELIPWSIVKEFTFEAANNNQQVKFSNMQLVWPEAEYGGFIQDVSTSPMVKVKHYLQYIPKSYDPSTQMGDKFNKIEAFSELYLKVDDKWIEIPDGKTAFFDLFGVYSEELRKYAKKNKLKINDPEDVGQMVSWVVKNKK